MQEILNYNSEGYKLYKLYKYRSKNIDLKWVDQVVQLIRLFKIKKINDLGCNYFQFYKGLKKNSKNKYDYFGYDIEERFIKLGLQKFPELNKNYQISDITKTQLRDCDCSIASAIIEHVKNPYKLIKKICKTSKKMVILRTYLGQKDSIITKQNSIVKYYFNQLSKRKMKKIFSSYGFTSIIILDEATNFSKKVKIVNNTHKRKMYILMGIKK